MLIAVEEHWQLPELAACLNAQPAETRDPSLALNMPADIAARLEDVAERRLESMDGQGIEMALLALTPPGTQQLPTTAATYLARAANDAASAAVAKHPDRFRALSTLPLSAPDHALAELERTKGAGHVGAMVYPHSAGRSLDDPVFDDLLAGAADLDQPLFLHPQIPPGAVLDAYYSGFDASTGLALATFGWGWHADAGLTALRLILRGTFERHPGLQIVLGHWGQMLLFWTDRADGISRAVAAPRSVSETLRSNFFITTSGMYGSALLQHALAVTTTDRLLFSTDYPFRQPSRPEIADFFDQLDSDEERAMVAHGNAAKLFGIGV